MNTPARPEDTAVCECGHDMRIHVGESAVCSACFCGGYRPKQGDPATAVVPMVVVPAELLRRCHDLAEFFTNDSELDSETRRVCRDLEADLRDALLTV